MAVIDPLKLQKLCWPDITFYKEQKDIIYSVAENDETIVVAGNQLGKDFVAGYLALWFFLSRPLARVVTTSVNESQLSDVLWGEINTLINSSKIALPLKVNHLQIRKTDKQGLLIPKCELVGQVCRQGEGLLGRHLARMQDGESTTFVIGDEASAIDDVTYDSIETWAHKKLFIGNAWDCTNFFFRSINEGDMLSECKTKYYRKILKIRADQSPNVRLAIAQKAKGLTPTNEILVPGVKSYADYMKQTKIWDAKLQAIGLNAEFYKGKEALLYYDELLQQAKEADRNLKGVPRKVRVIGIDPAEGGDSTTWTQADELGIIKQNSMKTPNTRVIIARTIAMIKSTGVDPKNVWLDRGGGGKQLADQLRTEGYPVKTVSFGDSATKTELNKYASKAKREEANELKFSYMNRRAEIYDLLRRMIDPYENPKSFGIPETLIELYRQMSLIPLLYTNEGKLFIPPKNSTATSKTKKTLIQIIGHSPDELDSAVIAAYGISKLKTTNNLIKTSIWS